MCNELQRYTFSFTSLILGIKIAPYVSVLCLC
nr:MAG TPA: hypothetical protein [Caudoviricetes sp.]